MTDLENAAGEPLMDQDCPDGSWGPEEVEPAPTGSGPISRAEVEEKDGQSVCVAICTMAVAIPSIVGAWCWPILVGSIFAVAANSVNGGLMKFSHSIQVAIMMALMSNITQFAWWNCKKMRRKQGHWYMFRPVYILVLSTLLVLVSPTVKMVIDAWFCDGSFSADQIGLSSGAPGQLVNGSYPYGFYYKNGTYSLPADVSTKAGVYYVDGCSPSLQDFTWDDASDGKTTIGWLIQLVGTYFGFLLMFIGVCQATNLHGKFLDKWRKLRGGSRTQA